MGNDVQYIGSGMEENVGEFIAYGLLSSMMTEAVVMLDFEHNKIRNISDNGLLLQDCALDDLGTLEFSYFKRLICSEDLCFGEEILDIVLNSFDNGDLKSDKIDYFSFLLRIKNPLASNNNKSNYIMMYVKLKPQWDNCKLRYAICLFSISVIRKQNHQLCVHYENKNRSEYSAKTRTWEYYSYSPLSKRQKEMLIWAQQGFSLKETAEKMNVADKTIECMRHILFEKLGVNSIEQAIQYAFNRRLIY